jgi:hypothetical protein
MHWNVVLMQRQRQRYAARAGASDDHWCFHVTTKTRFVDAQ